MEMPIKVMITLFVTLIVGFAVITFSRQIIEKSGQDLRDAKPGGDPVDEEQKIIELNMLDNQQVIDLVEECFNRNHGTALDRQLCFVVISKAVDPSLDYAAIQASAQAGTGTTVDVNGLTSSDYAIKIYYDPLGTEKITLSK